MRQRAPAGVPTERRHELLLSRLQWLRTERDRLAADLRPDTCGDDADRVISADALAAADALDAQIVAAELALDLADTDVPDGVVGVGSSVELDFGAGPETFLVTPVAEAGRNVITPASPLGRALLGVTAGSSVTYHPAPGRTLDVVVRDVRHG